MRQKILYFGCYQPLAATRCLLLEQVGFEVSYATDVHKAARLVAEPAGSEKPILVVVCNSCDDQLYGQLLSTLMNHSVSVPVLRLDETYPAAWRDPELLASLIRATIRGGGEETTMKKSPQGVNPPQLIRRLDNKSR
jgi:hypothetical protein